MAFAAQSPDLRRLPLVARASRSFARLPWVSAPLIRFLFVNSRLRYPLLSAPASRPVPFRVRLAVRSESLRPGSPEDLHLLVMLMLGTIDIGRRSPAFPVTPPDMRVRIRRLERLRCLTAASTIRSFPERRSSFAAVGASPLHRDSRASPFPPDGSSSCPDFWRMAPSRLTVVHSPFPSALPRQTSGGYYGLC